MPEDTTTQPHSTPIPLSRKEVIGGRIKFAGELGMVSEEMGLSSAELQFNKDKLRDDPNTFLRLYDSLFPMGENSGIFGEALSDIPGARALLDSVGLSNSPSPEPAGYCYFIVVENYRLPIVLEELVPEEERENEIEGFREHYEDWIKEARDSGHESDLDIYLIPGQTSAPIPSHVEYPVTALTSQPASAPTTQPTPRPVESQPTSQPTPLPVENYPTTAQSNSIFGESEYDGVPLSGLEQAVQKVTPKPTTQSTTAPTYHPQRDLNYLPTIGIATCLAVIVAGGALNWYLRKRRSRK